MSTCFGGFLGFLQPCLTNIRTAKSANVGKIWTRGLYTWNNYIKDVLAYADNNFTKNACTDCNCGKDVCTGGASIKTSYDKVTCIKNASIRDTYGQNTCISNTSIKKTCVRSACIKNIFAGSIYIRNTYAESTSAIKHLEIHLQFF